MRIGDIFSREIRWLIQEKYQGIVTKETKTDIARIKKGEPVDYVIGFVNFLDSKIDLSKRPLIPRTETEFWVKKIIEQIQEENLNKPLKFLDVFAGSGCIGISILKHIPFATVDFVDIDQKAMGQIKINCVLNGIDVSRYRIIQSNIFEKVDTCYDYIFANPPYIAENKKSEVQTSVLLHEPHTALFGWLDGMSHIRKFLDKVTNYLNENGKIYMEFGESQKKDIEIFLTNNDFDETTFYQDQFGQQRYVVLGL